MHSLQGYTSCSVTSLAGLRSPPDYNPYRVTRTASFHALLGSNPCYTLLGDAPGRTTTRAGLHPLRAYIFYMATKSAALHPQLKLIRPAELHPCKVTPLAGLNACRLTTHAGLHPVHCYARCKVATSPGLHHPLDTIRGTSCRLDYDIQETDGRTRSKINPQKR